MTPVECVFLRFDAHESGAPFIGPATFILRIVETAGRQETSLARTNLLTAVWVFAAGLTAIVCVCGAEAKSEPFKPLILTENDNSRNVAIKVDEEVEIKLLEEIGDRWVVESHKGEFVALVSLKSARAIGSSDRVSFSFRGRKAGTEEIALKRNRGSSVIDRFHVQVRVKPRQ